MAKITPIDVIKGISGKYGNGSNDYFATNSSSNQIHLAKYAHPYEGNPTEKQLAQQSKFKAKQEAASAWLNANKPSEKNGDKGTALYQTAQRIKRQLALSNVIQVLYKYMNEKNEIALPEGASQTAAGGSTTGGGKTQTGGNTQTGGGTTSGGNTSTGGNTGGSSDDDDEEIIHE